MPQARTRTYAQAQEVIDFIKIHCLQEKKFPLRTSSDYWKISFFSEHICDKDCKKILSGLELPLKERILVKSSIKIIDFNEEEHQTKDGILLYENNIIIPDTKIYINVGYPFEEPSFFLIENKDSLGFSLKKIIMIIKNIFLQIQREKYVCDCYEIQCPICLETNDKYICVTSCNHKFHKKCIEEWMTYKKNCPICRKNFSCLYPKNDKINGFSKKCYDLDELYIKDMFYDNVLKILYPTY